MMQRLSALALLVACAFPAVAAAMDADELEADHELSMEFVTPHVNWARPYAGGPTRVLFFCNGRGTIPRNLVELKERFDLDAQAVFWTRIVDSSKRHWHGGELGVQRMRRLLRQKWDCFVFLGIPVAQLPVEMQYKALRMVADGAGLVLIGVTDKRLFIPRRRIDPTAAPFAAKAEPKGLVKLGKGRGVWLPALPNIPYDWGWRTKYEYWAERAGRSILWAAGNAPRMKLQIRQPTEPGRTLAIRWENAPGPFELRVERLRDDDGLTRPLKSLKVSETRGAVELTLPLPRAGGHHVNAWAIDRGGRVAAWDWFGLKCVRFESLAIHLDRDWGEVGETLSGRVEAKGAEGAAVVVRLRDRRERILMRSEGAKFRFPIEPWLPMLTRVEAALVKDGREIVVASAWFHVTKRHRGQFNFLIWDVPRGALAAYGEESLARLGTTLQLGHGAPPRVVAAYDIAWVQYTTRILDKHTPQGIMKPHCWNDASKVEPFIQRLANKIIDSRKHGAFVYSLGDENHVRGACLHPACLNAYRDYLEQQYGSIDALNAEWGAHYKSFREVNLLDPKDSDEKAAFRQKNYPRWYDRQAFKSYNYVMYCKRFADAYRRVDPMALTGFEGAGRFRDGDDLDLFVRELGFWSPYPGTADEVLRSIAPRGFPHGNWMGYRKDADSLLWKYWRMVTRGYPSVWWWRWDCIGRFHGFLAPHLGPWPATKELVEDTQVVRDGLGDLLMRSDMLDDGVAMLYSMPSCYATRLEAGASYGGNEQCHRAWHRLIREPGLQFRYVTDRMLRRGEFQPERYKAFILCRAEALSPKAAKAVEDFARRGGLVAADVRPGIYDGHCKPQAQGALDALFGIRRTAAPAALKGRAALPGWSADNQLADPGVQLAGGHARGDLRGAPLWIERRAGKGRAVLLNLSLAAAPEDAADGVVKPLLAQAGVTPVIRTLGQDGRRVRGVETVRWRNGEYQIVALFRKGGEEEKATVVLPKDAYVYDLRHHKHFGPTRRFPTVIHPNRPTFFVVTPAALSPPQATPAAASVHRGAAARLALRAPGARGLHAFRLRVTRPDGRRADWLDRVVLVDAKPVTAVLPIAYNDPRGKWTVRVIDLYIDAAVVCALRVE